MVVVYQFVLGNALVHANDNRWVYSEIRGWLNNGFYLEAFSDVETGLIQEVDSDRVTLQSVDEAKSLLTDTMLIAKVTDFATSNGAIVYSDNHGWWWLKSPGNGTNVMYVNEKGIINESGVSVKGNSVGIRPAIWIDISQH